jgi:hypothetical protein
VFFIDGTCIAYFGQQSIKDAVVVNVVEKSDSNPSRPGGSQQGFG